MLTFEQGFGNEEAFVGGLDQDDDFGTAGSQMDLIQPHDAVEDSGQYSPFPTYPTYASSMGAFDWGSGY